MQCNNSSPLEPSQTEMGGGQLGQEEALKGVCFPSIPFGFLISLQKKTHISADPSEKKINLFRALCYFAISVRPIRQNPHLPQPVVPCASLNKNTSGSCSLDLRGGGVEPESGKRVRGWLAGAPEPAVKTQSQRPTGRAPPPSSCGDKEQARSAEMVPWEGYLSDETMGTFAPIVLYWVYAGGYQLILHRRPLERYRLHTRAEEEKNLVSLPAVVRGVLLQQLVQAIVAMILFMVRRQLAFYNCNFVHVHLLSSISCVAMDMDKMDFRISQSMQIMLY